MEKKVGVIGFGVVGSGVIELLLKGKPNLQLVKVAVKDKTKVRRIALPDDMITDDWMEIVDDPDIDVVVIAMSGFEPAFSCALLSLLAGKDVVTSNKEIIADGGHILFPLAQGKLTELQLQAALTPSGDKRGEDE